MPNGDQIEVLNPQGQRGNIPPEDVTAALAQGYKLNKHVVMYSPDGQRGLVPKDQLREAMKAGYQTTPKTQFEQAHPPSSTTSKVVREGTLGLLSGASGMPETEHPVRDMLRGGPPSKWQMLDPTGGAITTSVGAARRAYGAGKEAVHGAFHGDPEEMAHGAGSLVGQATQFAGAKEAPEATIENPMERLRGRNVRIGTEKVGAALKVPTSEEAIAASQGGKARSLGLDEARGLSIARDDLAKMEREHPVTAKSADGMYARAKNTFDYARDLWQQSHKQQIARHAMMPMDPKSLLDAGQKVLTPEAVENNPQEARAAQRWLQGIAKNRTLASMDELLRYINDDIDKPGAVDKYGNLGLQTKVAVAKHIRADIDNGLEAAGEVGVRDTNKRYAALQTVGARMIKEAIAEDVKGAREGKFPPWLHAYTFLHPSLESILTVGAGVNPARLFRPSPSKLLAKGMTRLAKSDLEPPPVRTPAYVGKSPIGLLPPVGGTHTPMDAQAPGGPPPAKAPARPMPESASQTFPLARRPTHGFDPQAPGGPRTQVPPIEVRAVPETMALARRPGSTPVSHLPTSGRTMLGDPTSGAALPSRVAEIPGPPREVESHMAGLLRTGTISRGEIMRMQRIGVLPSGSATRIFKLAGEKAP
jgi:hypothetical protein